MNMPSIFWVYVNNGPYKKTKTVIFFQHRVESRSLLAVAFGAVGFSLKKSTTPREEAGAGVLGGREMETSVVIEYYYGCPVYFDVCRQQGVKKSHGE